MLKLENVEKHFVTGASRVEVLKGVNLEVAPGSRSAILGPSGSGKSTLLGLCAGLDRATSGSVVLDGQRLEGLSEDALAEFWNRKVGFVFQNFQLIPSLTALENVVIPLELRGERGGMERARELLARVGLSERLAHYPVQLSGGEQQRVALARAFIHEPAILFADEPTGNLDEANGSVVEDLLFQLNREVGTTLVIVTHNLELAYRTERIFRLHGGQVQMETVDPNSKS